MQEATETQRQLTAAEWAAGVCLAPSSGVYKVDAHTVAKTGEATYPHEAATMNLVRTKTTIPVPEVYSCYTREDTGQYCILMEYIEGDVLRDVWDQGSEEWKTSIIEQLRGYMAQLKAIKGDFIGVVDGSHCRDQFFDDWPGQYGPYQTEEAFHDGLIKAMRSQQNGVWVDMVADFIKTIPQHDIVLTHSDFAPRNIIVRGNKVVAIIDWEQSGFYPAYWEYIKALYRFQWSHIWISDRAVDRIIQPYPLEHAILAHTESIVW